MVFRDLEKSMTRSIEAVLEGTLSVAFSFDLEPSVFEKKKCKSYKTNLQVSSFTVHGWLI